MKVKRKITGGFRAIGDSEAFCIIRTIWESRKLNHLNPFDSLRFFFWGGVSSYLIASLLLKLLK